ncbi:MAG: glycosyltransferase family 2 protein [Candidatus Bathyarchaeia archaeon]
MLDVSIVVSTFTEKRLPDIQKCLASLEKQTIQPTEVLLVLDPNNELVEFYRKRVPEFVKIIVSSGVGLSHARNMGIKHASGRIVAFIDDDALADPRWLENSLVNYENEQVMGVGGFISADWENTRSLWLPEELDWIVGCSYKGLPTKRSEIRNPIGCNMSFRKTVFDQVGNFRTDIGRFGNMLLCNEETEFAIRALKGLPDAKIIYEPSAIVYHKVRRNRESLRYVWTRSFYEGISKAIISSKIGSVKVLSTENSYLKLLISKSIPKRLRHFYRKKQSSELLALIVSLTAVSAGFVAGKIMKRVNSEVAV